MATRTRTKAQREKDLAELSEMLCTGWTMRQAAAKLGVSHQQIAYDWKVLLKRLHQEQSRGTKLRRAAKVAQLQKVRREAWAAWERSKENRERTTKEKSTGGDGEGGDRLKVVSVTEGRLPEDAYLRTVLMTIQEEAKLDGSHAPEKHALTNPKGDREAQFIREALGRDDTRELLAIMSDRLGGLAGPVESGSVGSGGHAGPVANGTTPEPPQSLPPQGSNGKH